MPGPRRDVNRANYTCGLTPLAASYVIENQTRRLTRAEIARRPYWLVTDPAIGGGAPMPTVTSFCGKVVARYRVTLPAVGALEMSVTSCSDLAVGRKIDAIVESDAALNDRRRIWRCRGHVRPRPLRLPPPRGQPPSRRPFRSRRPRHSEPAPLPAALIHKPAHHVASAFGQLEHPVDGVPDAFPLRSEKLAGRGLIVQKHPSFAKAG
jgi:hypothetical protein